MPTAYTAPVYDDKDIDFQGFVWRCSRAFGALMHEHGTLSNDAPDMDPPPLDGIEYHGNKLEEAKRELDRLMGMTAAELTESAAAKRAEVVKINEESAAEQEAQRARLMAMKERVIRWEPPSEDFAELKKFMIGQLDLTIRPVFLYPVDSYTLDPDEYRQERLKNLERDIKYHQEGLEDCIATDKDRRAWLQELHRNLEGEDPEWRNG